MPVAERAPRAQPETVFLLRDLASSHDVSRASIEDRLYSMALSQGMNPVPGWFDKANFVLATREQVEDAAWCQRLGVSLFVRCTGAGTERFCYPHPFAEKAVSIPVQWAAGRTATLDQSLWDVLLALSQGGCVVVHCNQSFHRGPVGLMAILRRLCGFEPSITRQLIVANRIVYEAYDDEEHMRGFTSIFRMYTWAVSLQLWKAPPVKLADPSWGVGMGVGLIQGGDAPASSQVRSSGHIASASSDVPPAPSGGDLASSQASGSGGGGPGSLAAPGRWVPKGELSAAAVREKAKGLEPSSKGRYLYRAMTEDLSEFVARCASPPWWRGEVLAEGALRAVEVGSTHTSAFVHFSWKFEEARH